MSAVDFKYCPAKTFDSDAGKVIGRSVESHCRIVGEVAKELIKRSPAQYLFPSGSAFTAATHDVGKVSPTFYNKIMHACSGKLLPNVNFELERSWNGHAGVSQLTARQLGAPEYIPEILGQHHGFSPAVAGLRANDENFGGKAWQAEREKLVAALQEALNETWPQVESIAQARLLAGLTSVSDWIGSGNHFEDPQVPWEDRVPVAVDDAGFVPVSYRSGLSFEDVFDFSPRQAQSSLIEQVSSPGVYVLEAPMGLGKTEASLYAAYRMLEQGQASGIYFALPTQLTSNKIFERFTDFLEKILAPDCGHRSLLLHANAWLFEKDMGEEGRPGGAWFNQSKRGLLAPFAVGTIDQALMAVMNVKHGFVRAFGLAGKVVILDEVHTYDAYTGTLLDALVELLRQLGCTVIILSATLNQERRQNLLNRPSEARGYPLITASPSNRDNEIFEISIPIEENKQFDIALQSDENLAVEQALLRAEQGQQILWIENTVKEAQQRFLEIAARAAEIGVACGLLHSRFTVDDRQRIEEKWVNLYGKAGWDQRRLQGRILVGTQVLEQSLDIDADFMVTRFAPTDMLLQRLGRLWRHEDTPRCAKAKPEAWLLAPDLAKAVESPQQYFGASAYVYSPYVLCRSLEVWQCKNNINLPEDIRDVIELTYEERKEQGSMARWLSELDHGNCYAKGRNALRQLARIGLAEGGNTLPESKAQTRYSETDSHEVLMLRGLFRNSERALLTLLDGSQVELPLQRNRLEKQEWRQRTATLMRQIVNVPPGDKPKSLPVDTLKRFGLQHCFYLGNPDWQEKDESVLHVALVGDSDQLRGIENTQIHDKHTLEYRDDLGYRVIKNQEL
ncbi:CRISPR-associated helicase Cas3' [Spongiibacter pelagi]|uniref:CRISPR-associated helicase Cas3' n=1 Tax=Spongiibacter pelagi TaxID=2760804 RepID=UPI00295B2460|nr:CRISPR-associated helicase Cas3' [Spongiibacter pelagi]